MDRALTDRDQEKLRKLVGECQAVAAQDLLLIRSDKVVESLRALLDEITNQDNRSILASCKRVMPLLNRLRALIEIAIDDEVSER